MNADARAWAGSFVAAAALPPDAASRLGWRRRYRTIRHAVQRLFFHHPATCRLSLPAADRDRSPHRPAEADRVGIPTRYHAAP